MSIDHPAPVRGLSRAAIDQHGASAAPGGATPVCAGAGGAASRIVHPAAALRARRVPGRS